MFETGIRQLRMALSMATGRRPSAGNVGRLVDDALATLAEFGEPGADVEQVIDGPAVDPAQREHVTVSGLRRTAARLAAQSPFYARRFAAAGIRPNRLDPDTLRSVPVTIKQDLVERAADFRCLDVTPHLTTRTTGTTGRPAEIWLSRYELELWPALGALSAVLRDELRPSDVMQVNVSSRATLSIQLDAATCRLAGAGCRILGIVPVAEALESLVAGAATLLATCPSYLAELVVAARRLGVGPGEFSLRRVMVGGELLSPSVAQAACDTLGVAQISDSYAMTEVAPVTARACSQGHLHHELNMGLVEMLDVRTGAPAEPGQLSTLVITPFYPFRECMPVFRYDTRDVVRTVTDETMTCEVAGIPASGQVLGKADQLLWLPTGTAITTRDLVDAVEALPSNPWPARFNAQVVDGRVHLSLPVSAVGDVGEAGVVAHLADRGLDVEVDIVGEEQAAMLRRTRSDLRETTFSSPPTFAGV